MSSIKQKYKINHPNKFRNKIYRNANILEPTCTLECVLIFIEKASKSTLLNVDIQANMYKEPINLGFFD